MFGFLVSLAGDGVAGFGYVGRGVAGVTADAGDAATVRVEVCDFDAHVCCDLEGDVR